MSRLSRLFFVFFLLYYPCRTQPADTGPEPTVTLVSRYSIDIDYNNFFKFFGGEVLGIAPDELVYTETLLPNGDGKRFSMRLTENGKDIWFSVESDTLVESFTHLPGENRKVFDRPALEFVDQMRHFLMCRDSCGNFLQGSFSIAETRILAMLSERELSEIPDEQDIAIRGTPIRMVAAHTRNSATADPYIIGDILVEMRDGHIIYPYIAAHLFEKNIKIKLYLKSFTVEYR